MKLIHLKRGSTAARWIADPVGKPGWPPLRGSGHNHDDQRGEQDHIPRKQETKQPNMPSHGAGPPGPLMEAPMSRDEWAPTVLAMPAVTENDPSIRAVCWGHPGVDPREAVR